MPMTIKKPCNCCSKNVLESHKGIFCDSYGGWVHLSCHSLNKTEYNRLSNIPDDWYYLTCLCSMFTFNDIEVDLEFMNCLFNFFNVDSGNKINANLIKNPHQLQLM